jgi:hypothetical protein
MSVASTVTSSQIPLPGGLSAHVTGSGGTGTRGINHVDWLGSVRLQTKIEDIEGVRAIASRMQYKDFHVYLYHANRDLVSEIR